MNARAKSLVFCCENCCGELATNKTTSCGSLSELIFAKPSVLAPPPPISGAATESIHQGYEKEKTFETKTEFAVLRGVVTFILGGGMVADHACCECSDVNSARCELQVQRSGAKVPQPSE